MSGDELANMSNLSLTLPRKKNTFPKHGDGGSITFEKLPVVLGRHYFDVCQRLALDYVPRCILKINECANLHNNRNSQTKCMSEIGICNILDQIKVDRPSQFVELLGHGVIRREFIEAELFVASLQLMLTIPEPSERLMADYNAASIVYGISEVLERCLEHFPPCRWDLRSAYQSIVFGELKSPCFEKIDQKAGLFCNVLHLIENSIETECTNSSNQRGSGSVRCVQTRSKNFGDPSNLDPYYYSCTDTAKQIDGFDLLSREERFQRLFAVLHILVKLLELDLAMWILRYPRNTAKHLCDPSKSPLVAQIVWDGNYGSVNFFIRKLFETFVNINALQYPKENIAVFSRLLTVVAVAVNLSENQYDKRLVQYPCFKENSQYYCQQLWKTLQSSPYFSVSLCLRTIRNLRLPFLRQRLSEYLFAKIDQNSHTSTMRGIFLQLFKERWKQYSDQKPPDEGGCEDGSLYPVLKRRNGKSSPVYREQYFELLYISLQAYCDIYQIPAFIRKDQTPKISRKRATDDASATTCRSKLRIVPVLVPDKQMIFRGLDVDEALLERYREDIKYLLLIDMKLKEKGPSEVRDLLRPLIEYLSVCLS